MRLTLIALIALALAGCWIGKSLYSNADARAAIAPGVYRVTGADVPTRVYRVSMLPSGLTQFDGGEKKEVYGFAPLDRDRGTYVAWIDLSDEDGPKDESSDNQIYALAVRHPNGEFLIYAPECKDEGAEIARKNGAVVETGMSPSCHFSSREALEKALGSLRREDSSALRLTRIP